MANNQQFVCMAFIVIDALAVESKMVNGINLRYEAVRNMADNRNISDAIYPIISMLQNEKIAKTWAEHILFNAKLEKERI